MESVPEGLRGSLVRDCRDPEQHEWQLGSIEAPLGIIPERQRAQAMGFVHRDVPIYF